MKCPECGKIYYPQICPSVIVGVTDGDKLLMTKYAARHSTYRRYALIAGYGEVGESLEATVIREVEEEVGLRVKNMRYFASQPWSFSDTLLVGFFCDVEGSREVTLDEDELSVAEWLTREEIPEESANSSFSLTGAMIKAFKDGEV
jgi:NAD+ diphosphatase